MSKKEKNLSAFRIVALVVDIIALAYFMLYIYWMFGVPITDSHPLTQLFLTINPMTIGTYCLGVAMLIHLIAYRNILGRCAICIPYAFSVIASSVSLISMTGLKDLLIFIPNVIIIGVGIAILIKQGKR